MPEGLRPASAVVCALLNGSPLGTGQEKDFVEDLIDNEEPCTTPNQEDQPKR